MVASCAADVICWCHSISRATSAATAAAASPGERQRRRLETARDARPDLLLLDEPTRDLDAGQHRLALDWVSRWRGGLLVVSHDRRVLRTFDQFFVVAESGCRHLAGAFDDLLAELAREREDKQRRYLAGLNRLVAREEHHAAAPAAPPEEEERRPHSRAEALSARASS